jgi:rare lipoprotein A
MIALATALNSAYASPSNDTGEFVSVVASHYGAGDGFHGKTTANCTRFDAYAKTAAHKTLRLGTKVEVCNPKNGKCEMVTITDRGPYHGNRGIDLASYGVAKPLGIGGVAEVNMRIVDVPNRPIKGDACKTKKPRMRSASHAISSNKSKS